MNDGIKIAQIADIQKGHSILKELEAQGIKAELREIPSQGVYELVIFNEDDHDKAVEVFCLLMGIAYPKKHEIPAQWQAMKSLEMGPVTIGILVLCVGLFLFWKLAEMESLYNLLLFSRYKKVVFIPEIMAGQWWRVFTPSFIHFGWMHIIFNMLWWKDLGAVVEKTKGSTYLTAFILVVSLISHPLQYLVSGPLFGGLSGVVYGLLGHLWMRRVFEEDFPYGLPKQDVIMMIAWFFLGLLNLFDMRMANMVHAVGLSVGMLSVLFDPKTWPFMRVKLKISMSYILFALGLPLLSFFVEILHS